MLRRGSRRAGKSMVRLVLGVKANALALAVHVHVSSLWFGFVNFRFRSIPSLCFCLSLRLKFPLSATTLVWFRSLSFYCLASRSFWSFWFFWFGLLCYAISFVRLWCYFFFLLSMLLIVLIRSHPHDLFPLKCLVNQLSGCFSLLHSK